MASASVDVVQVTEHVHLAHTHLVNWTLVVDGAGLILIDAGFPGQRAQVLQSIRQVGFDAADVRAVLLTHAHIDHLGAALRLVAEHGMPVYCHAAEVGHTRRDYLEQASTLDVARHVWQPRWLRWSWDISRQGAFVHDGITSAQPLTPEVAATLPGQPVAVPTPGHTGGHCSYLVDGVLVSGDALVTAHPTTAHRGPQLLHRVFNHDQFGCVASLSVLGALDTDVLVPGHGPLWRGPLAELTEQARQLS